MTKCSSQHIQHGRRQSTSNKLHPEPNSAAENGSCITAVQGRQLACRLQITCQVAQQTHVDPAPCAQHHSTDAPRVPRRPVCARRCGGAASAPPAQRRWWGRPRRSRAARRRPERRPGCPQWWRRQGQRPDPPRSLQTSGKRGMSPVVQDCLRHTTKLQDRRLSI